MTDSYLKSSNEVEELFAQTLQGDYEDDAPWKAVRSLHKLGTREVFDRAAECCRADDPLRRARGVDVLAQLGKAFDDPTHDFPQESFAAKGDMLEREKDTQAVSSAIAALGHIGDPGAVPILVRYVKHPDADVRSSLAYALGSFPNDPQSVAGLVQLTSDSDDETRDWATFGLGVQGDADSPQIRDALLNRLNDSYQDVRDEAMSGLGKRKDPRVLKSLLESLRAGSITDPVLEAAYLLLGMDEEPTDWTTEQYIEALEERFPQ
jgi:HEAT repeat protein